MRKFIFGIVAAIIIVLLFGPLVSGLLLQQKYEDILAFYNANSKNQITIKHYHRGWWNSDVRLEIFLQQKSLPRSLQATNDERALPPIKIDQRIQHGPIIYSRTQNLPTIVGLAAIQNKISMSSAILSYLKSVGMTVQTIQIESLISLFGNYFNYLVIPEFMIHDSENNVRWMAKNMVSQFWLYPRQQRISGVTELQHFVVKDTDDELILAKTKINIDQVLSQGVWLGTDVIDFADLLWKETDTADVRLTDVHMEGFSQKDDTLVNMGEEIKIGKLQIQDKLLGPFVAQVNINQFKFAGLHDLQKALEDMLNEGEYYQGELEQKIRLILPRFISNDSSVEFKKISLAAPHGSITLQGGIKWPASNFDVVGNLRDLLMMTHVTLDVQVTKKLMTDLVQFFAAMPNSIRDAASSDRKLLIDARNQADFAEKRNLLFIQFLSDNDYISSEVENALVDLQKNLVPMDVYTAKIKDLLLQKQIALIVSYQLCWQYAQMIKPYDFLEQRVGTYEKVAEKQLRGQFDNLLKRGYVKEDGENYTALLQWSTGGWTSNQIKVK